MTPNDSVFVNECESIKMPALLREAKRKLKLALLQNELEINGVLSQITTSKTGNNGIRYWFTCPICSGRCGVLFRSPLNSELVGCRKCLGVKY